MVDLTKMVVKRKGCFGIVLVLAGLLLFPCVITAQKLEMTAKINKEALPISDPLTYEVIITGEDLSQVPDPSIPDLKGKFTIVSSSQSNHFSIVNGRVSASKTRRYIMLALKEGLLEIPPSKIEFKGMMYQTEAIKVMILPDSGGVQGAGTGTQGAGTGTQGAGAAGAQVAGIGTQGAGAAASTQGVAGMPGVQTAGLGPRMQAMFPPGLFSEPEDIKGKIYLQAVVDKQEVYTGEPVLYEINLYRRVRLWSNIGLDLPDYKGFWVEDLPVTQDYKLTDIDGQRFYMFELTKKHLVPLEPGEHVIPPAKIGFVVSPFDGQRVMQSQPVKITVNPLPESGRPDEFSGIVGDFFISADLSDNIITQNTPVTVKIILKGSGNVKGVTDLKFDKRRDLKIYKSKVEDLELQGPILFRQFEYIVIPKVSGRLTIPTFTLTFFSPMTESYQTIHTDTMRINVMRGKEKSIKDGEGGEDQDLIKALRKDIHYLKSVNILKPYRPLLLNPFVWIILVLNAGVMGVTVFMFIKYKFLIKTDVEERKLKAFNTASRDLKSIERVLFKESGGINQLQTVLLTFLSHKTGHSFLGLTAGKMKMILEDCKLDEHVIQRILSLLDRLAFLEYAPGKANDTDKKHIFGAVLQIVNELRSWNV
ncbi:BatD family protein [Thermoproteota archaeon]